MTVETFADATPPAASAAAGGGGDAEKEAFDSARELGTVEAWETFIANYPSGFRADLARAYIKKLGSAPDRLMKVSLVGVLEFCERSFVQSL